MEFFRPPALIRKSDHSLRHMDTAPRKEAPLSLGRERIRNVGFVAATAVAAGLCFWIALPLLPAVAWAVALAVVVYPVHEWICRRVHRASVAATVTVALVTIIIVVPAVFVVREVAHEAAAGIEDVQSDIAQGRWRKAVERHPTLAPALAWIEREVKIRTEIEKASGELIDGAKKILASSFYAIIELLITLFLLFYFLRDRGEIMRGLRAFIPLTGPDADAIFTDVCDTIVALIYGILVVAAVQGALGGLMFWWLGLPAPLLWGTVMAVLAILPVLGAAFVWAPAALFLALEGSWDKALILAAWGGIVIALVDNLLYPLLIKNRMRLHAVPVFIAVLGGLIVFGAVGIVLGPVVLVVTVGLLEIWRRRVGAERSAGARAGG